MNSNKKSGQEVAKQAPAKFGKTDPRYWQPKLFRNTYTRDGSSAETKDWCMRLAFAGRRETINLRVGNQSNAASKAAGIYKQLLAQGWQAVLDTHKPKPQENTQNANPATIGDLLREIQATVHLRGSTFTIYAQALRRVASDIADIKGDKTRFDYRKGGAAQWARSVDAVPLSLLTKDAVQRWKLQYIANAPDNPEARRRAGNTVNAHLRNARALFSTKMLEFAQHKLTLPSPLPFSEIKLERKTSTRYISKINPADLLVDAQNELAADPERWNQFVIFLLALLCGLRKREIDTLIWSSVDFAKAVIRIEATEHFQPKTEDSIGEVDLAPQMLAILREHRKLSGSDFVIPSPNAPRHHLSRLNYRCEADFNALYKWLRGKGITARKALHELRKECGSIIASQQGIFAASRMLRHADIRVTEAYYADKKERITTGLDAHLAPGVIAFPAQESEGTGATSPVPIAS